MKKGSRHTLQTRQKMSEAHKGKKNPFWGKHHSPEARRRISEAHQGKNLSSETRAKMSKAGRGRIVTAETRQKIRESLGDRKGKNNPSWKGGRYRHSSGYIMVKNWDHPNADANSYMLEHRLIVEKALGRYLRRDELIHHKNGIKDDNRLENLELVDYHRRQVCPQCGWPMENLEVSCHSLSRANM